MPSNRQVCIAKVKLIIPGPAAEKEKAGKESYSLQCSSFSYCTHTKKSRGFEGVRLALDVLHWRGLGRMDGNE